MAAALRIVSVERGYDPREFALVAFGGAGPVHAARLAQELEIPHVIIPPIPGGFSALGLVASDIRRDYVKTFYAGLAAASLPEMSRAYAAMESEARAMLTRAGVPEARWEITRAADCRYGRQAYELTVPVAAGDITPAATAALGRDFHDKHRMTYGHASPDEPVQIVNLRVAAVGKLADLDLWRPAASRADGARRAARPRGVLRGDGARARRRAPPRRARAGRRGRGARDHRIDRYHRGRPAGLALARGRRRLSHHLEAHRDG